MRSSPISEWTSRRSMGAADTGTTLPSIFQARGATNNQIRIPQSGLVRTAMAQALKDSQVAAERRDRLGLPRDVTDEECGAAERRDRLRLPRDVIDEECEAAERRDRLRLPRDVTDEECGEAERRDRLRLPRDVTDEECEEAERRDRLRLPREASNDECDAAERRDRLGLPREATNGECELVEASKEFPECPICMEEFNDSDRRMRLCSKDPGNLGCKKPICGKCFHQTEWRGCPFCREPYD